MTDSKRSKITPEHQQESARLKALWDDGRPHRTQAVFGEAYGLGNQANVGHYLNGRSPLNPKAAVAFAAELGCSVSDFSPRVAEELAQLSGMARPQNSPATRSLNPAPRESTLEQMLDVLANTLETLPEAARLEAAPLLQALTLAPDSKKLRSSLLAVLMKRG